MAKHSIILFVILIILFSALSYFSPFFIIPLSLSIISISYLFYLNSSSEDELEAIRKLIKKNTSDIANLNLAKQLRP